MNESYLNWSPSRRFVKMHGLGNDFVIIDGREDHLDLTRDQARLIADRNFGIGCDQVITLWMSQKADVFMRIQNADGGEVDACGNATRCVGDMIIHEMGKESISIETHADVLIAEKADHLIQVDMGMPKTTWQDIPLSGEMDTLQVDLTVGPLSNPVCVNMGNPHAVFIVEDAEAIDLASWGPQVEHHALFPERVNVSILSKQENGEFRPQFRHRVWERGAGITLACGSAACATVVALSQRDLVNREAVLNMDGGPLNMAWLDNDHVQMTGPVSYVFEGLLDLEAL